MQFMNLKKIDVSKTFDLQLNQYRETLLLSDTVPAGVEKPGKVAVSNLGHFMLDRITGHMETLHLVAGAITDDGVNRLTGKLVDGGNQRQLFGDYVPLDLILSPGRVRSENAVNNLTSAAASQSLFYPFEFSYCFSMNSEIILYVKNVSDTPLSYSLAFHGWRITGK